MRGLTHQIHSHWGEVELVVENGGVVGGKVGGEGVGPGDGETEFQETHGCH